MKSWLTAGLALLGVSLGAALFHASREPDPSAGVNHPASRHAIINVSNEMMETMIADGTYSKLVDDSNSKVMFRVLSGGPTRISVELSPKGTVNIVNPAGIIMEPDAGLVTSSIEFHSTL